MLLRSKVESAHRRLWRACVCLGSLAVAGLVYTAYWQLQYVHIVDDKHNQDSAKRWGHGLYEISWIPQLVTSGSNVNKAATSRPGFDTAATSGSDFDNAATSGSGVHKTDLTFVTVDGLTHGRLGNQMFMYASLLGIARALNRTPFIDPGLSLDVVFKLHHLAEIPGSKSWPVVDLKLYATFERPRLEKLRCWSCPRQNLTISGYLQSWRYFHNISDLVRTEFLFRDPILRHRNHLLANLLPVRRAEVTLVGVHVRRTDLLSSRNVALGYTVPDRSYFMKAIYWMREKFAGEKVVFLVVSDDISWCRSQLDGGDVIVLPPAPQAVHLAVLTSCDHVIFSTGTFGWWGAWLSGGYVVYYKNYPRPGTNLTIGFSSHDFFPHHWVGLSD